MSSKLLQDTGEALYGPRWQTEMARALQVSDRTVRRWVAGTDDVPDGVYFDMWRLCEEKVGDLEELIPKLKRAGIPK